MITNPCEALVLCLGSCREAESPNAVCLSLFLRRFGGWDQQCQEAALSLSTRPACPGSWLLRDGGSCDTTAAGPRLSPALGHGSLPSPLLATAPQDGSDFPRARDRAQPSVEGEFGTNCDTIYFETGRLAHTERCTQTGAQICLANNNLCFVHE